MTKFNWKLAIASSIIMVVLIIAHVNNMNSNGNGSSTVTMYVFFGSSKPQYDGNVTEWSEGKKVKSSPTDDNSTIYVFHRLTGENQTVFSVMKIASQWGNFSITYSDHKVQPGIFIDSIAGIENGEGEWQYYINGEYGKLAADRKVVRDNDTIEWFYEK